MSLDDLVKDSTRRILTLEQTKDSRYEHEKIRQQAVDAAIAEARVYEAERDAKTLGQDLAITLISQASCLVDASQIQKALLVFQEAREHAETDKLKNWITEEISSIQAMISGDAGNELGNQYEYRFVERPLLDQLHNLGWQVIDQGLGIPCDATKSLRANFNEIVLRQVFKREVARLNGDENGQPWLSETQLELLYEQVASPKLPGSPSLLEMNEHLHQLLLKNQPLEDAQGKQRDAWLIDFKHPHRNHFLAINQFRIDTPHGVKKCIIPDVVLFVNGIPLVVIECKEASTFSANPMHEAFRQLQRYSEQRESTQKAGLREGEVRLFYNNLLMVRTTGGKADFGSITSQEPHYYGWRSIYPEHLKEYEPPLGKERAQEMLVQGMFSQANLLELLRCCTVVMDGGKGRVKVVARYQQFRAMQKIVERLRSGGTVEERSGVVWHTQGSGKSLTMVFVVRKLRASDDLRDYKVVLVNDRIDLEEQLTKTAYLTGEKPRVISSIPEVEKLKSDSSDLNLVMIHKFQKREQNTPEYFKQAVVEISKRFNTLGELNDSERILIMVDEAHRTQYSDLGDNLFEAFPNAAKVAFTGTPIIKNEKRRTTKRFGDYVDEYRLQDAVADGATLQILYEGRAADVAIDEKALFETKFVDLFKDYSDKEMALIRKRYGTVGDVFEAEERIEEIAEDVVEHYVTHILPNGFKAQVVCNSKIAAVRYEKAIMKALAQKIAQCKDETLRNKLEFLKTAAVVSMDSTNDAAEIVKASKRAKELNAVDNFKRPFNFDEPGQENTGIAFLIVCDMLLTGFDAPIEQVMYIDKKIKEHNLLQTIARVNRTASDKHVGYIVDYAGLANHLKEALDIYAAEDVLDVKESFKSVASEVPTLESRYHRLVQLFQDQGATEIEDYVQQVVISVEKEFTIVEQAVESMSHPRLRADFEVYLKKFMQSMDIIMPGEAAQPFRVPVKRFGFILAKTKQRYQDESLSVAGAGEKVRALINEHLVSLGIDPKIDPVELFSDDFIKALDGNPDFKGKASEMEHAIRKHCKVNFDDDPALFSRFVEKLEAIIEKYKDDWQAQLFHLNGLADEMKIGRSDSIEGLTEIATVIYERIAMLAFEDGVVPGEHVEQLKALTTKVLELLRSHINIVEFWDKPYEVEQLKGDLDELLALSDISPLEAKVDVLVTEIAALAKKREKDIVA